MQCVHTERPSKAYQIIRNTELDIPAMQCMNGVFRSKFTTLSTGLGGYYMHYMSASYGEEEQRSGRQLSCRKFHMPHPLISIGQFEWPYTTYFFLVSGQSTNFVPATNVVCHGASTYHSANCKYTSAWADAVTGLPIGKPSDFRSLA